MGNFMSSENDTKQKEKPESKIKSEPEPEPEGNFCQGYLVSGCNIGKNNVRIKNCDKRFVVASKDLSETGYLKCTVSKDGKICETDKSDLAECELEVDGLPYCEPDTFQGPGMRSMATVGLGPESAKKAELKRLDGIISDQQKQCQCEDGKKFNNTVMDFGALGARPTYHWNCE
tara:strand:- start:123 stop:644 length:522 start_codon:yes stop_codon:yes gene_type:complete